MMRSIEATTRRAPMVGCAMCIKHAHSGLARQKRKCQPAALCVAASMVDRMRALKISSHNSSRIRSARTFRSSSQAAMLPPRMVCSHSSVASSRTVPDVGGDQGLQSGTLKVPQAAIVHHLESLCSRSWRQRTGSDTTGTARHRLKRHGCRGHPPRSQHPEEQW